MWWPAGTFAACLSLRNVRSKHGWAELRPQHQSRHLCKARRKRTVEDEADDEDEDEAGFQSSRGSNEVDDDELPEDDAEEVEGATQAVAGDDNEDDEEEGKILGSACLATCTISTHLKASCPAGSDLDMQKGASWVAEKAPKD